jgi:hypothetical protein
MLRTSEKFDRALTVIAFLHRNFAKGAHTDRWLYAASNGAQGDSVALPVVSGKITKVLMAHFAAPLEEVISSMPTSLFSDCVVVGRRVGSIGRGSFGVRLKGSSER